MSGSRGTPLQRLEEAGLKLATAEWDVSYYGRYLTSSSTSLYVPDWLWHNYYAACHEYRAARTAAMERAFS